MTASLHDRIRAAAPDLRGRLLADQSLADLTWFRVGGPAEVLFTPADEEDLARLLAELVLRPGMSSRGRRRHAGEPGTDLRRTDPELSLDGLDRPPAGAELDRSVTPRLVVHTSEPTKRVRHVRLAATPPHH